MPFIIDSPYQQEMSGNKTAGKISNLLMEFSDTAQVIVFSASMQNEIETTNANMVKVNKDLY